VALVRTDVSEELSASFIRVTRIGELGTTLAVTSNRRTLRRYTKWFLQEPHGVTSQKTPFFIVTTVKTSNLAIEQGFPQGSILGLLLFIIYINDRPPTINTLAASIIFVDDMCHNP
jgi:hypothetical protein